MKTFPIKNFSIKSGLVLLLAVLLLHLAATPAPAADFADVQPNAWYASAVNSATAKGLMQGNSQTEFAPKQNMTRAMTVKVLHRIAKSPKADTVNTFADVPNTHWASDAISWGSQINLINGYENGNFGINDEITRQDFATLLWRFSGNPQVGTTPKLADADKIDSYAETAMFWCQSLGIINGTSDGLYAPHQNTTRAECAAILCNYTNALEQGKITVESANTANSAATSDNGTTKPTTGSSSSSGSSSGSNSSDTPATTPGDSLNDKSILVTYFSATGNTRTVAGLIASELNAITYEITPRTAYSAADLDYNDQASRVSLEKADPNLRPEIAGSVLDLSSYDIIFLGYPIWWDDTPTIIKTFVENAALGGKTVIPFATSAQSSISNSTATLKALAPTANWQTGHRFAATDDIDDVASWLNSLNLNK